MAKLIPLFGPRETESFGEKLLYYRLEKELPNDYIVIQSLPLLASAVKEDNPSYAPTGEIDFIVIGPLGILTLEIKSGVYEVRDTTFIHKKDKYTIDPLNQIKKNSFGLNKWLKNFAKDLNIPIGYAVIFPDSSFDEDIISTGLIDKTIDPPENIFIDKPKFPFVADRIIEIMKYWKKALKTPYLNNKKIQELITTLCPQSSGVPSWAVKITYDNQMWLPLTEDQDSVIKRAIENDRIIVTGWPGTGKTLIATECAKKISLQDRKILILTFNVRLVTYLREQLEDIEKITITHWHDLCRTYKKEDSNENNEWFETTCVQEIKEALSDNRLEDYDVLILDEAQAFKPEWCDILFEWFKNKQIITFCDETQLFEFEKDRVTLSELAQKLGNIIPFYLTIALRTPQIITNHLQKINPPTYQLSVRPTTEQDSFQEILTNNMMEETNKIIDLVLKQGVEQQNIVILCRIKSDISFAKRHLNFAYINYETVSRYRGLESPVVIILNAEHMDDKQLFSACSRATTVCIALYDSEYLVQNVVMKINDTVTFHGNIEAFHRLVVENQKNIPILEQAKKNLLTTTLISKYLKCQFLPLKTLLLAWSEQWQGWLLQLKDKNDHNYHWISYLQENDDNNIYYWYNDSSLRTINCYFESRSNNEVMLTENYAKILLCNICNNYTPHIYRQSKDQCLFCYNDKKTNVFPKKKILHAIKLYDENLNNKKVKDLPLELIPVYAQKMVIKSNPSYTDYFNFCDGEKYYKVALILVISWILWSPTKRFTREELSKRFYKRYSALNTTISFQDWDSKVASAINVCCKFRKVLEKTEEGDYIPQISI
ncbi:AAA family ATPase [Entomomonas sp. E2T0]|uniref:nuclease-related domain-containing DEAD/DEAH box helicase n=1 Tax=Entomomonas sp. E2T0 TaxID=2930213 RepID=UPI00222818C9|nr:NERD domain-containing protein [Entomomonas sp. E2T0]UYZ85357.1 AAA family ATPase [Entomomonas sp. E2T0]